MLFMILLIVVALAGVGIGVKFAISNFGSILNYSIAGVVLLAVVIYIVRKLNNKDSRVRSGLITFMDALPSLFMLIIVIGGIVVGFFTATEASAIAVLYSLILAFLYKEVNVTHLPAIILNSVKTTAVVMLLIATSIALSWIMSYENIPQNVSAGLMDVSNNPFVILLIINLILLFVGIFMDMTPAVLIFTPIFLPVVTSQLGLSPIHFGIVMVLNLSIGLCTPPVGSVLFIGCSVAKIPISKVVRPLVPLFIAMIVVLLLVTYIPELSLWLPRLFDY
jgi:tripartite ATP-independent transporter DctM subunit